MNFKLNLKRGAMRRKRGRVQVTATEQRTVVTAFGSGDDSEGSEDAPRAQKVTTITAHVDETSPTEVPQRHTEEQVEHRDGNKSASKTSQIVTIVERRKKANISATVPREQRDEALFRYEIANCPDEADSHHYEQRPVEGFGEMMLKNMGWFGKETREESHEPPIPRPNRLGLGAKPSALKKPVRRKRLREAETKTTSTPDKEIEENDANKTGECVTIDSIQARSEFIQRPNSKRPR